MILCTKVKSVGSVLQIELWSLGLQCLHVVIIKPGPAQSSRPSCGSPLENFVMAGISKDTEAPLLHAGESQISCLLAVTADFEIPQHAFS